MGGDGEVPGRDPRRWRALAVCLVAGFMTLLDVSIVNVAVPSIRLGLHAAPSEVQWVLSGYALTFGLVLVPAGRLGDARSRRAVFVAGLVLFVLTSALAGLAGSAMWLVVARLAQGACGGLLVPQVSGFIQEQFRGAERGRAFGLLGSVIGVSTAVGPILGGLLIQLFGTAEGWRWVFFVNIPVGLAAVPLALRLLPGPERRPAGEQADRHSFDPVGTLLLGCGVVLILLPLVEEQSWHGPAKWLLLVPAALLLAAFVGWERRYGRSREPLVDLNLFRVRSYSLGAALGLIYFAGFTGIFFILTLYFQSGEHYSALLSGLAVTPFAIGSGIGAAAGGRLVARYGRTLVACGLLIVAIGLAGAALAVHLAGGRQAGWATTAPLLLAGFGSGLVITPNLTVTLSRVPVRRAGSAGGVVQTAQRMGSALGIAAIGAVFFSRVGGGHPEWGSALQAGLLVAVAFVVPALVLAVVDARLGADTDETAAERADEHAARPG
ncbi:MFS transporter [Kitasatospora sp. RB6PN24]|uniref:MFS transporter n=1 Tax=Kitasatospora humi TaxID=2893891 RepID=UPI001E4020F9|nr:MFS transporter [Kitasatospora humi]MCC9307800.1 MFS transporter [Kitasatospora humi]